MRRRLLVVVALAAGLAGCGAGSPRTRSDSAPATAAVDLTLGAPGRAVPRGFLGLSTEFQGIRAYTGDDPAAIDPVFEALVRNLSPGQAPQLRIGGNSTDVSYVPVPGLTPRFTDGYALSAGWMATTAALAHDLGAQVTLGLNLADDQPALDVAEARDFLAEFGRGSIAGFELGNEPNLYAHFTHFTDRAGTLVHPRPPSYGPRGYDADVARVARALPPAARTIPLVGPALAAGLTAAGAQPWTSGAAALLRTDPAVKTLSIHRYPLKNCFLPHSSPMFPTIAHLVSNQSTVSLAAGVRGWVRIAHRAGRGLRIDELNSAACKGRPGVSNTFASALWATDALFSLGAAGVDGVNVHTTPVPTTAYALFAFSHTGGRWSAAVRPDYYGLQLFAQAAPAGSRLISVRGATHSPRLSVWATRSADDRDRVVLIDKDPGHPQTVTLPAHGPVTVERMQAPGLAATSGVTLGGRTYGQSTATGRLGAMRTSAVHPDAAGRVTVTVTGASAALLTFPRSPS